MITGRNNLLFRVQKDGGGKKKRDPFTKALVDVVADFLTMYYNVQE